MENANFNSKNLKLYVAAGIALIIVVSLIVFFVNNVVAFVSINNTSGSSSVTLTREGKKVGGSGIVVIPRGSQNFEVTAGDSAKTLTTVSQPWYGFTSQSIDIKPSKEVTKVGFMVDAQLCTTYNASRSSLLRYDCSKPKALIEYQTPSNDIWGERTVADLSYIDNQILPAYKGGVLGVAQNAQAGTDHGGNAVSINATSPEANHSYKAPGDIATDNLSNLRVYTDNTSSSNPRFILVDRFGTIYLGTPGENNDITYKQVSAPDTYNSKYNQTFCTIHEAEATCYRGRNATTVTNNETALTQASIDKLSFDSGIISSTKVKDSPLFTGLLQVNSELYGRKDQAIYSLVKSGDSYVAKKIIEGATSASGSKTLYFTKGGAVFAYDNARGDSYEVFWSPSVKVAGLYTVDGKVFLFGGTKDSDTYIYAYELTNNDYKGGKRLIDALPLDSNSVASEIYANELVGNKVFLQLYGDSISDDEVRDLFISKAAEQGIRLERKDIQTNR